VINSLISQFQIRMSQRFITMLDMNQTEVKKTYPFYPILTVLNN